MGKPNGAAVAKTVGATGGAIVSGDGVVRLTIPAGSLAKDTMIGIQPISNTTGESSAPAYRLSPSGQIFTKPVQLTFTYGTADLEGTAAEALGVVSQDAKGVWRWQNTTLDTSAKSLTVMTTHFSDWSRVAGLQLRPPKASVKVKGKVTLIVRRCVTQDSGDDLQDLVLRCGRMVAAGKPASWAVDGAPGGTTGHGLVTGNTASGVYTAPAHKPAGVDSVSVSVTVDLNAKRRVILSSVVRILDGFTVVGTFTQQQTGLVCAGTVSAHIRDRISLSVVPGANGTYTIANLLDSTTTFAPPRVPIAGLGAKLVRRPEIFTTTKTHVDATGDLVIVGLIGNATIGACNFGGPIKGTGSVYGQITGVSFHTNAFVDGVQKDLPSDRGEPDWKWTVTER